MGNPFQKPAVLWIVKKSFAGPHKLKEKQFMAVATKWSCSFYKEEWDFNQLALNKIFRPFQLYKLSSYCQIYQKLSLNKLFANFKLQKHGRILFFCFRYRPRMNDKIVDFLLLLTFTTASLLLLATTGRVCFTWNYHVA